VNQRPAVLFVCVHNAGRSQMAAAFTEQLSKGRVSVRSAGSEPTEEINPPLENVREIRDAIQRRVESLMEELALADC